MKKLIVVILVLLVLFTITKNFMAKVVISTGVRAITGLKLSIKSVDIGIFRTLINIKGLEIFNPDGFEDRLMADAPEIHVDYNLGDFLRKKAHFEELRLNLKKLIVIKNREGELNLNSLRVVKKKERDSSVSEKGKVSRLEIDSLELKIEKVIYKDYSTSGSPKVREYDVNINERYQNIKDPKTFVNLILFKALINTGISDVTNFDLVSLGQGLGDTLGAASKTAGKTAGKVLGTTGDTVKGVTEKTVDTIKDMVPFGK